MRTAAARASSTPALGAGAALVLAGIVLSAFNLRTAVTSITPLLDVLGREFAFGATMAGVLGMLPSAAFAVFGVATPAIAHRAGLERTVLLAMALAAAGLVLRSFAPGTPVLIAGSVVALAGAGIGNVVLPPLVKRYFATRIGVVSTLYIAVLQMGTILPALLAVPVAAAVGWRISLGAWALVAVAAMLPWLGVLWIERRADSALARVHDRAVLPGDGAPELAAPPPRVRTWRTAIGWGMALMFGMTSLMTYALFTWLPKLLTDAGASPAFGGAMVALFAGLGLFGALVMPAIAVRMRNPFPIVLACAACQVVAYVGLLLAPMAVPLIWVSLLGLGGCTFPLALTLLNKRTRTPAGSAALSGFTQGMGYTLACLGPLLFGLLHEATGSWAWPFAMLAASAVVMLLGAWQACKPRYLEDAWQRATTA
ncbi:MULTISPECIES: MFS transporter [unclassified Luteimonas]|uniref:MFS transporter n=1 Tax=unclassified Luteimonas TaxID=2629088 RepID=UPI0015FF4E8C|nr:MULTISPECIES: MFS transporter [unclassified Luteimonas]MBB1471598.1 MFS transporter [Luteimonas sp. MC1782]MBB6599663.1 MFS transporter [Luteimonas sp. MC1825]QOC87351.1 MFS transporter [Luteimonas sp. MC1825]